jgi:hypothetical protein
VSAEVRIDPGAIARTLRLRNGIVARRLAERTERTARFAEEEAPGTMGDFVSWKVEDGPRGLQGSSPATTRRCAWSSTAPAPT